MDRIERMNRMKCKYKMLFSPYPCISSCLSSPSCPKNLESPELWNTGNLDRIDRIYRMNADSISGIPHLHCILFILSILSKESGIFTQKYGNFRQDREDEQDWMQIQNAFFPVSLHFILFILSILSKESGISWTLKYGKFRQDLLVECRFNFRHSAFAFHPVYPVQRFSHDFQCAAFKRETSR